MIHRDPSFKRDLKTGIVLSLRALQGKPGLFRKRRYSVWQAMVDSLIFLIPMAVIFLAFALWTYNRGDMDAILRLASGFIGLAVLVVWITHGACGHDLGGCGSETD